MSSINRTGLIGIIGACLAAAPAVMAQSNSCATATPVTAGSYSGTNVGSTQDGSTTCVGGPGPDVWYRYTAPQTGFVTFDTCVSVLDSVLSVHTGCPGTALNTIACNDDGCGLSSRTTAPVTAGQTYYVRIAGFGGETNPFWFNVSNVFSGGETCDGAQPIGPGTYQWTTVGSAPDGSDSCNGGSSPDRWYMFEPATNGTLLVDTCGSSFDTVLSVQEYCEPHTVPLGCNDDSCGLNSRLEVLLTAGHQYLIRVAGFGTESGAYTLHVGFNPQPNQCAQAQVITDGVHFGSTLGATADGVGSCGSLADPDVWYSYTAASTGTLSIDTCSGLGMLDTVISVHSACPGTPANTVACNDDNGGCGLRASLDMAVTAGQTYLIRVAGFFESGPFTLTVGMETCPADWDDNGSVNSADVSAFLTAWLASVSNGTLIADFNHNGTVNSSDISAFLTAWLQGVQTGC